MMFDSFAWPEVLLYGLLGLLLLILAYYYIFIFGKFFFYKPATVTDTDDSPVSVIIAARNEYANLEKNLKAILEQDYPNYEVVVVNDCSWDESQKLLEYYQEVYPHLKVCKLIEQEKYPTGKKFALTIGIKASSHEHLLFTDADCRPATNQWLRLMKQRFVPGKEIVLGFSPYKPESSLLNLFIRFETALTAFFCFGAALRNNAFMGVGRNLAYTKTLFFKNKGYANHQYMLSGDDDLFVNENATRSNVAIQIQPEAFMITDAKKSFSAWAKQKIRHNTTGKLYQPKHKLMLGLYYSSLAMFYAILALIFILQMHWPLAIGVLGFKILLQCSLFYVGLKRLNYLNVVWAVPFFDVLYVLYVFFFGTAGMIARPDRNW